MPQPSLAQRLRQIEQQVALQEDAESTRDYLLEQVAALRQADQPEETVLARLFTHWLDSLTAQEALRAALQQAEEDRQSYIATVTHELRIPLTALKGYSDLLLRQFAGPLNERQLSFLHVITSNLDRMNALLSSLGDLNRLQGGRMHVAHVPFALAEAIDSALNAVAPLIASQEQSLTLDADPALPPLVADPERTAQVLSILLDNASRYTPERGELFLHARAGAGMAHVAITDNGIGIGEADQARLFTPFFRSDDPDVRDTPGWGLGLALAKGLVEAQGGQITFSSQPGKGTTFTFTIPLANSEI